MGLARPTEAFDDESMLTQAGSVIGTPDFICAGNKCAMPRLSITERISDSLGCTFYFLLTGRRRFPRARRSKNCSSIRRKVRSLFEQIRRGVTAEVVQVVNRLMEKNVNMRFQSAQEVVDRLVEVQRSLQSATSARSRVGIGGVGDSAQNRSVIHGSVRPR